MAESTWARLYARGFFLGTSSVASLEELEHFQRYDLTGYRLYADKITEIGVATHGNNWLVTIGKLLPLSTGVIASRGKNIATDLFELLQREGFEGLERALYDIGGRHALLIKFDNEIYAYHDAGGHRTVYFNPDRQHIASHFDMLHRLTDVEKVSCPLESQRSDASPERLWDLTGNPHIRALLPNHRLHLGENKQPRFGLMHPSPYKNVSWTEKIETIHQLWHEQLEQLLAMNPGNPLGVSLSGGLDSRTVLAHMKPYLENVRAFTYTSEHVRTGKTSNSFWHKTMVTDHNVLAQLQDHLPEGFHVLIKPKASQLTNDDRAVMQRNTIRNHGRHLVPMYKDIFPDINSIHVRGNFVEMGRLIRGRLDIQGQKARLSTLIRVVARRRRPNMERYPKLFWSKVDEFEYDLLHEDVEYTDAYHLENRSSRWYAEIANETDTVFDSIVPVNARRIYDILTSPRADVRPGGQLQIDLIHRAWPELLAYGINDEKDHYTASFRDELVAEVEAQAQNADVRGLT